MLKFNGTFQLVNIVKESKSEKGNKVVHFTAATRRDKEHSDFKLFRIIGKGAETFMELLEKKSDGKYKSRKMFLSGSIEGYKDTVQTTCEVIVKANELPEKFGKLTKNVKCVSNVSVEVDKEVYFVTDFEFLDSKGASKSKKTTLEDDTMAFSDADEDDEADYVDATKEMISEDDFDEIPENEEIKKAREELKRAKNRANMNNNRLSSSSKNDDGRVDKITSQNIISNNNETGATVGDLM